ncbi:hypothetical protein FQR65_LT08449 [Abscondita terminalis]|nr:hypothetical protein FQR65_LT08449 [Abscondita terminalis]
MEKIEEKDVYVLLDFEGKDMNKLLKAQSIYFRAYEDTPGTNIFFEEVENDEPKDNLFEKETPISLKYLLKQSKVLKLKHIGTKPKLIINPSPIESVNIDITVDYRSLLEKYKNENLKIDDYLVENACLDYNEADESIENEDTSYAEDEPNASTSQVGSLPERSSSIPEWYSSVTETTKLADNPIYAKYLKLQKLAEQPSKHKIETEDVSKDQMEQPLHTIPKNNFMIWKDMMMRVVERQSITLNVNKHKMEDFVNIDLSIKLGIIEASDANPRLFTKREKQKLLSFKNFISLTPLMKLIILQDCLQYEKSEIENMNKEQTEKKGENDLSPNERVKLLNDFKEELKLYIINRIKDAQKQNNFVSTIDFDINLSDDSYEESSTDDYDDSCSDSGSDHMSLDDEDETNNVSLT